MKPAPPVTMTRLGRRSTRFVGAGREELTRANVLDSASRVSANARLEDVEPLVEQVVADHERRQEAQHVPEAARRQRDQALLVAGGREPSGERRVRRRRARLDEFEASIAPRPRTSPIDVVLLGQRVQARAHDRLDPARRAGEVLGLHRLDRAERRGAGDRVAAVRPAETAAVHGVHDLGATGDTRRAAGRRRCPWPS